MAQSRHNVDYKLIVEKLEECSNGLLINHNQGDNNIVIPLAAYLDAFRQFYTLFCSMGKIFDLVASEINSKINVLECYLQDSDLGKHYTDVNRMLDYESTNNLLKNTKKPSGSRTLLRLHRGLEFVYTFLERIVELPPEHNIASKAAEAYKATLGKHHPWTIYCGMLVALKTLSTTKELVKRSTDDQLSVDEFRMRIVPDIIRVGKRTHELMEEMYAVKDCLELP